MLVLARKAGESVVIDGDIRVTVNRIRGRVVQLGIDAPANIRVDRNEVSCRRTTENDSCAEDAIEVPQHSAASEGPPHAALCRERIASRNSRGT